MPEPNPVIETIATLICPWCGSPFEDRLLCFDMACIGRTVNVAANPLCPKCRLLAEQKRAAEELARQQEREADWARMCPAEYRLTTESDGATDFDRLRRLVPIVNDLMKLAADPERKRGLLLRGDTGMGKTRTMFRVVRVFWERGIKCAIWTPGQFEAECQAARDKGQLKSFLANQIGARVLFMDDLAKTRWYPSTEGIFFDIVEARTRDHRLILVTTNHSGATMEKLFSDNIAAPLVRRLRDHNDCFAFEQGK
jgi:DNA replication protein DnaC